MKENYLKFKTFFPKKCADSIMLTLEYSVNDPLI